MAVPGKAESFHVDASKLLKQSNQVFVRLSRNATRAWEMAAGDVYAMNID